MVYYCDDLYHADLSTLIPFLPPKRREKAERYQKETDRQNAVGVYLLLRYALLSEFQFTPQKNVDFILSETGKPDWDNCPAFFSLSHCRKGVAVAVSERTSGEIGVDMQDYRSIGATMIKKVCSPMEQEEIQNERNPEQAFSRLWSLKESYFKQTGKGIQGDLSLLDFSGTGKHFHRFGKEFSCFTTQSFSISLCAEKIEKIKDPIYVPAAEMIKTFADSKNMGGAV